MENVTPANTDEQDNVRAKIAQTMPPIPEDVLRLSEAQRDAFEIGDPDWPNK